MSQILNITNGDCAVEIMRQAGIAGELLPWRDLLHFGPVPGNLSLSELSDVRAKFIADQGWGAFDQIAASFAERDRKLASYADYQQLRLWFEHDLYDQLQLIQILDWLYTSAGDTAVTLIGVDHYLGTLIPDEMAALLQHEKVVSQAQLTLAHRAWEAFTAPTPEKLLLLLEKQSCELPFLKASIVRMLEEYPDRNSGLSRTQQQILTLLAQGPLQPGKLFGANQQLEEHQFIGDAQFWVLLQDFLSAPMPLLTLNGTHPLSLPPDPHQTLAITDIGKEVLCGQRNWFTMQPRDYWIGGVHLTPDNLWYRGDDKGLVIRDNS